jgi:hypothetical protein
MRSIELHRLQHEPLVQRLENVSTGNKARADALDYIKRLCNAIRRHFDDWIYESYGVREAGWIGLGGLSTEPGAGHAPGAKRLDIVVIG